MQGLQSAPAIGEAEIYLVHIGKDDYRALKANKLLFNLLLRHCGGIPIRDCDKSRFCASIAFTSNRFREDFAREMEAKTGIYIIIDFNRTFINRKHLPPVESYDKFDLELLSKKAMAKREREKYENNEPEYYYPTGKQVDGKEF